MITIREAVITDAPSIIDFQKKMAWETESLKLEDVTLTNGVNAVFADPSKGKYFIAEDDGKTVSSLLITYEWSDWRNSVVWWIQSVYVIEEFRRKGVFRIIYNYIADKVKQEGIAGLRLYVETNNLRARKTYEAMGMDSAHYMMFEWLKD